MFSYLSYQIDYKLNVAKAFDGPKDTSGFLMDVNF